MSPSYLSFRCFLCFFYIFLCRFLLDDATLFSKLIFSTKTDCEVLKLPGFQVKFPRMKTPYIILLKIQLFLRLSLNTLHLVPSLTTVLFGVFSFLVFHTSPGLSFTSSALFNQAPTSVQAFSLFCSDVSLLSLPYLYWLSEIFCTKHSDVLISKDLPAYQAATFSHLTQAQDEKSLLAVFEIISILCSHWGYFCMEDSRTKTKLHCKIIKYCQLVFLKHYHSL